MKTEISNSFIKVPVPTALYVSLADLVSKQASGRDPASVVVDAIGEWMAGHARQLPQAPAGKAAPHSRARDARGGRKARWSDDWIMFGAPRGR